MALLAFPELAEIDHLSEKSGEGAIATATATATTTTTTSTATKDGEPPKPEPAWATLGTMMRKEHRIKVAKELNAAILESQGQGQETRLGGLVKLMSWGENQLHLRGVRVPILDVSTLLSLEPNLGLGKGKRNADVAMDTAEAGEGEKLMHEDGDAIMAG